jgi:hypothetical protein
MQFQTRIQKKLESKEVNNLKKLSSVSLNQEEDYSDSSNMGRFILPGKAGGIEVSLDVLEKYCDITLGKSIYKGYKIGSIKKVNF